MFSQKKPPLRTLVSPESTAKIVIFFNITQIVANLIAVTAEQSNFLESKSLCWRLFVEALWQLR